MTRACLSALLLLLFFPSSALAAIEVPLLLAGDLEANGSRIAAGVFVVRLATGDEIRSHRIALVR
jgi:hypothetical protein